MVNDPVQPCGNQNTDTDTKKDNWVGFKIINKENSQPLADVSVNIEMPNGDFCSCSTDGNGEVKIPNLDPGNCKMQPDWRDLLAMGVTVSQAVLLA